MVVIDQQLGHLFSKNNYFLFSLYRVFVVVGDLEYHVISLELF